MEPDPVCAKTGELKNSRIIREAEQGVVVRQYREVQTADATLAGGNKFYIEQYVFLEKLGEWKLRGVLRSEQLSLSPQDVVVDYHYSDVTGDGQKEEIVLIAARDNPDGIYTYKTRLLVAGKEFQLNPEEYVGYGPSMQLMDLNGDKVDDFLVFMNTGESAGATLYCGC